MPWAHKRICPCGCGERLDRDRSRCHKRMQAYDAQRGSSTERGYGGKWKLYSRARLRKHPTCVHCGAPATITNHIKSAQQFPELFWDKSNHESVCVGCNNRQAIACEGGFGR